MADIVTKVITTKAFRLEGQNKVVPEDTTLYIQQSGNEKYYLYDISGAYIGHAFNIPYKEFKTNLL